MPLSSENRGGIHLRKVPREAEEVQREEEQVEPMEAGGQGPSSLSVVGEAEEQRRISELIVSKIGDSFLKLNENHKKLMMAFVSDRLTGGEMEWGDLCRKAGVGEQVYRAFKLNPAWTELSNWLVGLAINELKASVLPVTKALIKKAKEGDIGGIKVYYGALGMQKDGEKSDGGPPPAVVVPGWMVVSNGDNAKTFDVKPEEKQ